MQTKSHLNSLLLRWNGDTGAYQGAQCARFLVVYDDSGIELTRGESRPISVDEAVTGGLPLATVIGEATVLLLIKVDEQTAAIKALTDAAKPVQDALDAANATIAALQAQITALQPPAVVGVSSRAIKIALVEAGLLDQFEATVSDPQDGDGKMALISWQEDDAFTKTSPALVLTFARMKLTAEQSDALFVAASKL